MLVTDNPAAGALQVASQYGLPKHCVSPKEYTHIQAWDEALVDILLKYDPDFILLAGFLRKIGPRVLNVFQNRIINSHPSLLPKYGGKGLYGRRVHEAVMTAGEKSTGVTVHLVNEKYDAGPILRQMQTPIVAGETTEHLENRVKKIEKAILLEFLNEWKINSKT